MPGESEIEVPPEHIVERFLQLLSLGEVDDAVDVLDTDVVYTNVSLPTLRGSERVRRLARATLGRPGAGFEVYLHAISTRGGTVLTERTDVLTYGPVRIQFWVCGRFDVEGDRMSSGATTSTGLPSASPPRVACWARCCRRCARSRLPPGASVPVAAEPATGHA